MVRFMGFIRVFNLGLTSGLRNKKRTIPLLLLFLILFSLATYQLLKVESYNTDSLVATRGIIVETTRSITASDSFDDIGNMKSEVDPYVTGIFAVYYVEVIPGELGVISVYAYKNYMNYDWRWIVDEMKPTRIVYGHHVNSRGEAVINANYRITQSGRGGLTVEQGINGVGSYITLTSGDKPPLKLKIVGVYNTTEPGFTKLSGGVPNLLFISWDDFRDLVERVWSPSASDAKRADFVYIRRVVFLVSGDLLSDTIINNLETVKSKLTSWVSTHAGYDVMSSSNVDPSAFRTDLTWGLTTILFSLVLAFIYAFIIVKFRNKDIAVLRAIGWKKIDVLGYAFGEFFLIIFSAYVLSLVALWLYGIVLNVVLFFTGFVYLASFGLLLASLGFGYFIVSRRVSKISPERAFREG